MLRNACADRSTVVREPHTPAFEQIGHGSGGFIDIPTGTAHREDQVTKGQGEAAGGFEGLFHELEFKNLMVGFQFENL